MTENGIRIYSYPNPHLHSFCIALYVKAGCLYEPEEDNGITHLLEHLVFRNIDKKMDEIEDNVNIKNDLHFLYLNV